MLRFLTAGESHGKGLAVLIEGLPAGLALTEDYIATDLRRRQGGYGRGRRQKIEQDRAEIRSGVRHGRTLGSPIALLIENKDWVNWQDVMALEEPATEIEKITRLRPGHADLAGVIKYGFDDVRPILERASARETAARVAVGAVCRRFLEEFGLRIHSQTVAIDGVEIALDGEPDWETVEASAVRCADSDAEERMIAAIDEAREAGDSLGELTVRRGGRDLKSVPQFTTRCESPDVVQLQDQGVECLTDRAGGPISVQSPEQLAQVLRGIGGSKDVGDDLLAQSRHLRGLR
ncbi:MAG: chorismate synthase, partial [Chloroflexi bacterium]|nr:chorismate synthase [Chloroflexota bacterium]